jgi:hypothetical protein
MLRVLEGAVAAFGGAEAFGAGPRFRELRLGVETEGFPPSRVGSGARAPARSTRAEPGAPGVPAPDFASAPAPAAARRVPDAQRPAGRKRSPVRRRRAA